MGLGELTLTLLVAVLVFGPEQLPAFARYLGLGVRRLRKLQLIINQQFEQLTRADQPESADEQHD